MYCLPHQPRLSSRSISSAAGGGKDVAAGLDIARQALAKISGKKPEDGKNPQPETNKEQ